MRGSLTGKCGFSNFCIAYFSLGSLSDLSGLFIIDGKGITRQITINDLPVGRDVDETLRLVQAFQFTDQHGEGQYYTRSFFST